MQREVYVQACDLETSN